jgi:probable F420-dependent oxidoreductase
VKIATMLNSPHEALEDAARLESLGYDALFTNESKHDPFVMTALAALRTRAVELVTYIAVAFARTPMLAAHSAHDVNALSKGRFVLGLGSQIKPHVTRRFSMPWSHPAPRMREYIRALHAIWDCWYEGKPLDFRGEFYTHTLTSPMFIPTNKEYGRPKVMLGAVGPEMCKVAAEVADGLLCHSFTTARYLREVTIPNMERVLAEHGRPRSAFRLVGMPFVVLGETQEALDNSIRAAKNTLAFYGSTPSYQAVLDLHGWGGLQPELLRMSKQGQWQEMGTLISDEIVQTFCVVGNAAQCARQLKERYEGVFELSCGYTSGVTGLPPPVLAEIRKL